jgi:hypothetical protein
MPAHQVKNCSRPETLSVATVLTDADRAMYHALELGFETMRDLGPAVSISGSAHTPVGDPITSSPSLGRSAASPSTPSCARRRAQRHGRARPHDVPAAPAEQPLTGADVPSAPWRGSAQGVWRVRAETWGKGLWGGERGIRLSRVARFWLSIRVELIEGGGRIPCSRRGRVFVAAMASALVAAGVGRLSRASAHSSTSPILVERPLCPSACPTRRSRVARHSRLAISRSSMPACPSHRAVAAVLPGGIWFRGFVVRGVRGVSC